MAATRSEAVILDVNTPKLSNSDVSYGRGFIVGGRFTTRAGLTIALQGIGGNACRRLRLWYEFRCPADLYGKPPHLTAAIDFLFHRTRSNHAEHQRQHRLQAQSKERNPNVSQRRRVQLRAQLSGSAAKCWNSHAGHHKIFLAKVSTRTRPEIQNIWPVVAEVWPLRLQTANPGVITSYRNHSRFNI